MSSINWKRFIQTREGALVRRFFIKLTKDIAQDDRDKTAQGELKNGEPKKEKVLLLNTKKGYWLYKIFQREECGTPELPIVHVVSDRFVQKQVGGYFWCNKIVYLVDDTLTRGYSLMETYELLFDWMNEKDIRPIVFALNEGVDIEKKTAGSTSEATISFWKSLKYYTRMSQEEMGHFCTCETKMMHAENIPYVIDLPYLKEACQSQKINYEVILTKEQFTALQQENELWKFQFNDYKLEYDMEGKVLQSFILETKDEQLLAGTEKFISNYIITGTYSVDERQKVHLVFVPFAIAHSVSMGAVKALWNALMGEGYTNSVGAAGHSGRTNHNLWKRCYRECVYVMSMEIAERFKKYLEILAGIRLCYDYDILMEHFSREFIDKVKEIEKELMEDSGRICRAVESLQGIFSRSCSFQEYSFEDDNRKEHQEEYNADLEEAAYDMILSEIEKRKKAFLANPGVGEKTAVLEYEEIDKMLGNAFSFRMEEERRYVFTRIIVTLLLTSMCSGRIFVDEAKGMIRKGARYGENSDLLLPFLDLNFYWAIVLLVEKEGRRAVLKSYDRLVRRLNEKYRELGLCGNRAAENRFFRNEQYFRMVLENDFQLYNKYFYFEPYFKGIQSRSDMYYMKKIEQFVDGV